LSRWLLRVFSLPERGEARIGLNVRAACRARGMSLETLAGLTGRSSRNERPSDILDNIETFLDQADGWRTEAQPLLAEYRRDAARMLPEGTAALAAAAGTEIEACGLAAAGRWAEASRAAQDAARQLGVGMEATRGYRALWLYLAGTWADQAGDDKGDPGLRGAARALVRKAEEAAKRTAPRPGPRQQGTRSGG